MRLIITILLICAVSLCGCRRTIGNKTGGIDKLTPSQEEENITGMGTERFSGVELTDVNFKNVQFAFDSYQIESSEEQKIKEVADYLKRNRNLRLVVDGHCDERGTREYNLSLGERRALAVRAYLISLGIEPERIQTRSFGEDQPLDPGHNESAWRQNRRAEFKIMK